MSNENNTTNRPRKSGAFTLTLYPDNPYHCTFVDTILDDLGLVWYGMLHDKDLYREVVLDENGQVLHKLGEPKKPHWHIIVHTPYAMSLNAFADSMKYYEIEPNLCDTCNKYFYTRYITHIAFRHTSWVNFDKHYYPPELVIGDKNAFQRFYAPVEAEEQQQKIWDLFEHIRIDPEHNWDILHCLNLFHQFGLRSVIINNAQYMRILQQILIEKRSNNKNEIRS